MQCPAQAIVAHSLTYCCMLGYRWANTLKYLICDPTLAGNSSGVKVDVYVNYILAYIDYIDTLCMILYRQIILVTFALSSAVPEISMLRAIFPYPTSFLAKIQVSSMWSRSMMLGSAKRKDLG